MKLLNIVVFLLLANVEAKKSKQIIARRLDTTLLKFVNEKSENLDSDLENDNDDIV